VADPLASRLVDFLDRNLGSVFRGTGKPPGTRGKTAVVAGGVYCWSRTENRNFGLDNQSCIAVVWNFSYAKKINTER
jgi:hypothetical protein